MSEAISQSLSVFSKENECIVNIERRPSDQVGQQVLSEFPAKVKVKLVDDMTDEPPGFCFWTAWNKHRDYLQRLSYIWMNISAADAEDALSVATLRAFEKYGSHAAHISNERAWFARLLHNICIDIHRSNKRRSNLSDKVKEIVTIDASDGDIAEVTPEAELLNSELGATLMKAINELPGKLQTPLVMRLVSGDEYDYIAQSLDISNDNARKRVQQARAILRKRLSHLRE